MADYNSDAENCWDFWGCAPNKKEECLVFKKGLGKSCWYVPSYARAHHDRDFDHCWDCPWYKKVSTAFKAAS